MPDLASRNEASTSWALLPIEDTMPMPVTTTRFMGQSSKRRSNVAGSGTSGSGFARLEQADPQVLGRIDGLAVGLQPAIAGAEGEFAADHPLQLDDIFELAHGRQHHSGEFDLADVQGTPTARRAEP